MARYLEHQQATMDKTARLRARRLARADVGKPKKLSPKAKAKDESNSEDATWTTSRRARVARGVLQAGDLNSPGNRRGPSLGSRVGYDPPFLSLS